MMWNQRRGHIVFPTITDGVVYVEALSSISSIKIFNLQGSILSEVKMLQYL